MPSLANPLQGTSLATFGTKPLLTPEVGTDIYGKQSSLANPFQISGASTYGTKPGVGIKSFFSVGLAGDYKTINPVFGNVTITIATGIASFSFPQLHPYIGIGDKVSWSGGYGYLSRKILPNQWFIVDEFGIPKPDLSAIEVTSITKVFNKLEDAIQGATPGLNTLLGSYDLKTLDVQPNIVCYVMNDTTTTIDIPDLWTIDASRYIKIFVPWNTREECNVSQMHQVVWGTGYNLTASGNAFEIDQSRMIIQGLQISSGGNKCIEIGNSSAYNIIRDNVIKDGTTHGIHDTNNDRAPSSNYYISNVIYDCGIGIEYGVDETLASLKHAYMYSNTIKDCATGVKIRAEDWGITYNGILSNNILQDNTTDIDTPTGTEPFTAYNSISSDATISNVPTNVACKPSTSVEFNNVAIDDLHLSPGDTQAVEAGKDLHGDPFYPFDRDIDNELIDDTWDIGADHTIRRAAFSVGAAGSVMTGTPLVTITDGIMSFSTPQTNSAFGIGDKITYDTSKTCYVIEKLTTSIWRVTAADGTNPNNEAVPVAVNSIAKVFNSLNAAIDGSPSGVYTLLGSSGDLVGMNLQVLIPCYDFTDNTAVASGDTWITDSTRKLFIFTPVDTTRHCNTVQRFIGGWGSGYKLDVAVGNALQVSAKYSWIEGLQVRAPGGIGIYSLNSDNCTIFNNIVKDCSSYGVATNHDTPGRNFLVNNLVYDCDDSAIIILDNSTAAPDYYYLYNNTEALCKNGIFLDTAPYTNTNIAYVKNNIAQYSTEDDYAIQNEILRHFFIESSVGSDTTVNSFEGLGNHENISLRFRDLPNRDFHLHFLDKYLIGIVTDLTYDPEFAFSNDFDNTVRMLGNWDPGVDNFDNVVDDEVFYSVGKNTGVFHSSSPKITIFNGVAIFDNPQLSAQITIGDEVLYNGTDKCYLAQKGTQYIWRVVTATGQKPPNITSSQVTSIKRTFNTLAEAIDNGTDGAADVDHLNTKDLTAAGVVAMNLVCCDDDGIDTDPVNIQGWTTSSNNKIRVLVPWSTVWETNQSSKHIGKWGTGFQLSPSSSSTALTINSDNVEVLGIMVKAYAGNKAISVGSNTGILIRDSIIRDATSGIENTGGDIRLINNLVYNCTTYGIDCHTPYAYNNTVINCNTGINHYNTGLLKNNICQDNLTTDYISTINLFNCISSDASAGSANGCQSNITLTFVNKAAKDFHLFRSDTEAIGKGLDLRFDPVYPFDRDIDNEVISEWCIGCDNIIPETSEVYFSFGQNVSDHKSGSTPTVAITSGIATFSEPQVSTVLAIGDKVDYHPTRLICYLKEKISTTQWRVADVYGETPADISAVDLNLITHAYDSFSNALTGVASDIGTTDLEASKFAVNLYACDDGSEDVTPVSIPSTWITDESHTLYVRPPHNQFTECNVSHRHSSVLGDGYVLHITSDAETINCLADNIILDNLQIINYAGRVAIQFNGCSASEVRGCIIKEGGKGVYANSVGTNINYSVNNIVYDCTSDGVDTGSHGYIINNTIQNCSGSGVNNSSTTVVINTICQSNGADFSDNTNIENCLSSDASAGSANGCQSNIDLDFINEPNDNFNLAKTDVEARGTGKVLVADPDYAFDSDAIGRGRGLLWDLGALEFADYKKVYYSVGQNTNNHITGSPQISIVDSIATFSVPQTSEVMGVGDIVGFDGRDHVYLKEKISSSKWVVCTETGDDHVNDAGLINHIKHAFGSLREALDFNSGEGAADADHLNTKDLRTGGYQLNIACYDDGISDEYATLVKGWTADDDTRINIFTPTDEATECNKSQTHSGSWGDGFRIDTDDGSAVEVDSVDFTTITGIQTTTGSPGSNGIYIKNSGYVTVKQNVAQGCNVSGIVLENQPAGTKSFVINNVTYNNSISGIHIGHDGVALNETTYLYNNTCVDNFGKGIFFEKGSTGNTHTAICRNNISQYNTAGDFIETNTHIEIKFYLYRCVSRDNSASLFNGSENFYNINLKFSDKPNNIYSLDYFNDFEVINRGLDLTNDSNYQFNYDINGRLRLPSLWDPGAFESYPAAGTGDLVTEEFTFSGAYGEHDDEFTPLILYLRKSSVGPYIFSNIDDLNTYMQSDTFNSYLIYVEGDETFYGSFEFGDRNIKTVRIETDPTEKSLGPGTIVAAQTDPITHVVTGGAPLVGDTCLQGKLTFRDIKLQMHDDYTSEKFIESTANTEYLLFQNAIVQINDDTIVPSGLACKIEVINSLIIYRNTADVGELNLSQDATEDRIIANSQIITYRNSSIDFRTVNQVSADSVHHCILWNYGSGGQNFTNTTLDDVLTEDPQFTSGQVLTTKLFNIASTMIQDFQPTFESPCYNAGDKTYSPGLTTDILGRSRTFEGGEIDIGPYEIHLYVFLFGPDRIKSIFQDKLTYDPTALVFETVKTKTIYEDLPKEFVYDQDECEEYARESKLFIQLKPRTQEFELISDKKHDIIFEVEGHYDVERNTIVFKKLPNLYGETFIKVFEDGRYVFHFDSGLRKLRVFFSNTYQKGMSGHRSVVKNIRFGGPTLAHI